MNKIESYLKEKTRNIDSRNRDKSDRANSEPCAVCGCKDLVQLYRNVVGEIEGHMSGNFSLFGGSVSGSISGYTKTLPVLSCTKCHNERLIKTWQYTYDEDMFYSDIHNFYFSVSDYEKNRFEKILPIYLENPIDTRDFALDNKNYDYDFYNSIPYWGTETWASAGFNIKQYKFKKKFLFFKWEEVRYPTWEELKNFTK